MGKKMQENTEVSQGTQNILNIITPSSLDFTKSSTNIGESTGKIYAISRYPSSVDYGWLSKLCNLDGTMTVIEYKNVESDNLINSYNSRIKNLNSEFSTAKTESDRQDIQRAIDDIKSMISRIKDEPFGYVNIMLFVQDFSERRLETRIRKVNSMLAMVGASSRILPYKQKLAYRCISPYGIPDIRVANIGNRNMPISSFLGGFPMSSTGINDGKGFYMGKSQNGSLVILDTWLRGGDRTNGNWWVQGIPGSGKSSAVKLILLMEWALGTKIIIMDPEREVRQEVA